MTIGEELAVYKVFVEDMLHDFQGRFDELNDSYASLTEYEKGRWMGYHEIVDIIKSRKDIISDMLSDDT